MAKSQSPQASYKGVFDTRLGFGQRPALINVDFINAYVTEGAAFYAAAIAEAAMASEPLLDAARAAAIPVIHTRVVYHPTGCDGGLFVQKVPALRTMGEDAPLGQITSRLAPLDNEPVIRKQYASAFFATSLASMLTSLRIDTIILIGCSTSGCIRATAVDGIQHGFRVIVPRECVGDRHDAPHQANLFDIDSKYGDVVGRTEVMAYLTSLPGRSRTRTGS